MRLFGLGFGARRYAGPLTAEQIDLCCRLILGRGPNRAEADRAAAATSLDALREVLLDSDDAQRLVSPARANADKKPLLLIGFPRGFTSQSYTILKRATGLGEHCPSSGEFLNLQRLRTLFPFAVNTKMTFYDTGDHLYEPFAQALEKVRNGYIVKDVVQPFHVLRYLDENPAKFNVVYVRRNLSHVAFSLMRREWGYVHKIGVLHERFSRYPALDVDSALDDVDHPIEVVRKLGYAARGFNYRDQTFLKQSQEFAEAYARDAGKFDLAGLIANNDRRDVVGRFGASRDAGSPPVAAAKA